MVFGVYSNKQIIKQQKNKEQRSVEEPSATGGLVSNLPHSRVYKTKQHTRLAHDEAPGPYSIWTPVNRKIRRVCGSHRTVLCDWFAPLVKGTHTHTRNNTHIIVHHVHRPIWLVPLSLCLSLKKPQLRWGNFLPSERGVVGNFLAKPPPQILTEWRLRAKVFKTDHDCGGHLWTFDPWWSNPRPLPVM